MAIVFRVQIQRPSLQYGLGHRVTRSDLQKPINCGVWAEANAIAFQVKAMLEHGRKLQIAEAGRLVGIDRYFRRRIWIPRAPLEIIVVLRGFFPAESACHAILEDWRTSIRNVRGKHAMFSTKSFERYYWQRRTYPLSELLPAIFFALCFFGQALAISKKFDFKAKNHKCVETKIRRFLVMTTCDLPRLG